MRCSNCETSNISGASFCENCGNPLNSGYNGAKIKKPIVISGLVFVLLIIVSIAYQQDWGITNADPIEEEVNTSTNDETEKSPQDEHSQFKEIENTSKDEEVGGNEGNDVVEYAKVEQREPKQSDIEESSNARESESVEESTTTTRNTPRLKCSGFLNNSKLILSAQKTECTVEGVNSASIFLEPKLNVILTSVFLRSNQDNGAKVLFILKKRGSGEIIFSAEVSIYSKLSPVSIYECLDKNSAYQLEVIVKEGDLAAFSNCQFKEDELVTGELRLSTQNEYTPLIDIYYNYK